MQWHLITPEYPPDTGGVADYTRILAQGLSAAGDNVHVWCPASSDVAVEPEGVIVHRDLGKFRPANLRRVGKQLDHSRHPLRILVQWVPHGYGFRSMNLGFCVWVWSRSALRGDRVEIVVHEAFLAFGEGSWRQYVPAAIHRLMTIVLIRAASRIWVTTPRWEQCYRPYALGRRIPFRWLPIPTTIAPEATGPDCVENFRGRYARENDFVVGHFGTYGPRMASMLEPILLQLTRDSDELTILLMGAGSDTFLYRLVQKAPEVSRQIHATGKLETAALSHHLSACDLLMQPYPDGVSTRRTSVMAGLSHGKPIITTKGAATEALWESSEAVAVAPVEDIHAFVQLVHDLRADAARLKRMGQGAKKLYHERFDICHTIMALRES